MREDYISKVKNHIKNLDKRYSKLFSYFEKNWIHNKYFNFPEINDEEIIKRTNNICENYHKYLNTSISHYHPKLSYLLVKLKETIYDRYKKYFEGLIKKIDVEIDTINIYKEYL